VRWGRALAACALVLAPLAEALAGGLRHRYRFEEFEPPLTLPEGINGTLRASLPGAVPKTGRIDRIREVFPAVRTCWTLPEADGRAELTLRLSFRRDGAIIGQPRVTYSAGEREARSRLARSVREALERCAPLPFTRAFGAAVAGRPFTFRFIDDRRS
jgi:hypothetical protein